MIILSILLLSSVALLFSGCDEDVLKPEGVNLEAPVVKAISAASSTVLIGESVEVSVEADDASSYQWSAEIGTFEDPTAATTMYTAPMIDSSAVVRVKCTVTNSSGSRYTTVTVKIATSLAPEGVAAWWSFDTDLNEQVGGFAPDGGVGVSVTSDARVGDGAALFEGEDMSIESALLYPNAAVLMNDEEEFSVSLWINTEDDLGWIFGKTYEGDFIDNGKAFPQMDGGAMLAGAWGISEVGAWDDPINDGQWHHVALVYIEGEVGIYIDGEEVLFEECEWSTDEGTIVTIGAAWEEEGGDWPGTFQGMMDDIRFYQYALSEEEIIGIFEE